MTEGKEGMQLSGGGSERGRERVEREWRIPSRHPMRARQEQADRETYQRDRENEKERESQRSVDDLGQYDIQVVPILLHGRPAPNHDQRSRLAAPVPNNEGDEVRVALDGLGLCMSRRMRVRGHIVEDGKQAEEVRERLREREREREARVHVLVARPCTFLLLLHTAQITSS